MSAIASFVSAFTYNPSSQPSNTLALTEDQQGALGETIQLLKAKSSDILRLQELQRRLQEVHPLATCLHICVVEPHLRTDLIAFKIQNPIVRWPLFVSEFAKTMDVANPTRMDDLIQHFSAITGIPIGELRPFFFNKSGKHEYKAEAFLNYLFDPHHRHL
ncbi:MAG TPA: hypothetical protein VJK48_07130 [Chlamydiales bacterium]|nr:MAG: hypothetical protein A3F67_08270 [Verrucomicrobia bacterium RIFCSPHIGHO2_12_FULL_41_10]HLB53462.1 hypothetical protein [Chlamydiales bacterium]